MTQAPSFGVRLDGLPVRWPAGTALEFIAQAVLHPLPLAPARVAGLMQLRGQPLVVLDASSGSDAAASRAAFDVLVVGTLPNAAGVLVDEAPVPAEPGGAALTLPLARAGALAECPFLDAIVAHRIEDGGEGAEWYEVDPARLFDALLGT